MKKKYRLNSFSGKYNLDDYWSTDSTIKTPFFANTISRNKVRQIWPVWHISNNEYMTAKSSRILKIGPIFNCYIPKFNIMYMPEQELCLDGSFIPWKERLRNGKIYNPNKLIKYGLLRRMVCKANQFIFM